MDGSKPNGTHAFRYTILYLFEDLSIGAKFKPSILHINILPWFALETDEKSFTRWFYNHFDNCAAFEATVGEQKMFGPAADVPVHLIEPQAKFQRLHELALSWFGDLGARWAERDPYVGHDYKAHTAERYGIILKPGQKFLIDSVTLVKAKRHDDFIRIVEAKAGLKATD